MPFVTLYVPHGLDDGKLEKCMREITEAGANTLENTLTRMIRVTVFEADQERIYNGGSHTAEIDPVVLFRIGPGRSAEAKDSFMAQIADILHNNLGCDKERIREYVLDNNGPEHHFCIGGKPKDFSKKVK